MLFMCLYVIMLSSLAPFLPFFKTHVNSYFLMLQQSIATRLPTDLTSMPYFSTLWSMLDIFTHCIFYILLFIISALIFIHLD